MRIYHQLSNQLTPRQSQVAQNTAQADCDNEQTDENNPITSMQTTESGQITTTNKSATYSNKLIVHYTHEHRFCTFKRDLHQIHDNVLSSTLGFNFQLMVGNRNRPSAKKELIHKKPKCSLIQNKAEEIKTKYMKFRGNQ